MLAHFFRAQGEVFKLFLLSNQTSKNYVYYPKLQREASNRSSSFEHFCLKNDLSDYIFMDILIKVPFNQL